LNIPFPRIFYTAAAAVVAVVDLFWKEKQQQKKKTAERLRLYTSIAWRGLLAR
jgi:hypothetical protein